MWSRMANLTLTKQQARLLALQAQGLLQPAPQPASKKDVLESIRRMGALQIDTINVIARSPYLSLWSRLGNYDPAWLDELLPEKRIYEYWAHAACFLPIEDFPLHRRLNLDGFRGWYSENWREQHQADIDRVLEHIHQNGEVKSASFERQDGKRGAWWDWKIEKNVLEYLFQESIVMVARRERFQRVYDLRERLFPDWQDSAVPPLDEVITTLCLRTLDALGFALPSWVADYFRLPKRQVTQALLRLKGSGCVIEIGIDGMKEPGLVSAQSFDLAAAASKNTLEATLTTLLSPFDALIWDRKRAKQLFDFDYSIEVYLPQHKRVYGYYLLPILHRGELAGRLDAKAHRQKGIFEVKSIYLEPGTRMDETLTASLAAMIRDCAAWHKTPEVQLGKTQPAELLPLLQNYF